MKIKEQKQKIKKNCELCKDKNVVFGDGPLDANIMFIGEAPGFQEDLQGKPFVGRAGKFLDELLKTVNLNRKEVYISNIVKCLDGYSYVKTVDGWKRINWIYRNKYRGKVYCIDKKNRLTTAKILNAYRSLVKNKKMYKLSFISSRNNPKGLVGAILTEDHYVLTKNDWKQVRNLNIKKDRIHTGTFLPSHEIYEATIGILFGDGNITSNNLVINHSFKQKKYLLHLAKLFERENKIRKNNHANKYTSFVFNVPVKPYIRHLKNIFYKNKKKEITEENLKDYSIISLAYHFMDDGYLRIRPPRKPSAEIATLQFTKEELKKLSKKIKSLGIDNYINRNRIYFNVKNTRKLSKLIAPYIPKCMNYKIIPKHRKIKKRKLNKNPEPFYDSFELHQRKPSYKYVYDIEVEKYHNFLTHSGVVHNCRPPKNRDPTPKEIKQFYPFLDLEIKEIKPKIIIPLGRHASKTIFERYNLKFDGISSEHGKIYKVSTLFGEIKIAPMYHPAAAIYNPNLKDVLKEDLKNIIKKCKSY